MRNRPHVRKGFVLLLTLAFVAIAALMMVGTARQSLLLAVEAAERQERLQRHWGELSCKRAVLRRAEAVLRAHEEREAEELDEGARSTIPRLECHLVLGELRFDLQLADENAKVNLNTVAAQGGPEQLRESLAKLTSRTSELPVLSVTESQRAGKRLSSWGQVFNIARAQELDVAPAEAVRAATDEITCWGDGRLNVRRASDEALRHVCELVVPSHYVSRLVELRREHPEWELFVLLNNLQLRLENRRQLEQLLTDGSSCHSLWIVVSGSTRKWHSLSVSGDGAIGDGRIASFAW